MGLSPIHKAVVNFFFHFFTLIVNCLLRGKALPSKQFLSLKETALEFSVISDTIAIEFITHPRAWVAGKKQQIGA